MTTQEEKDIIDFADKGDFLNTLHKAAEIYNSPVNRAVRQMSERTALYIEFLAAAFIKETGMNASECELVCEQLHDVFSDKLIYKWYFKKREVK